MYAGAGNVCSPGRSGHFGPIAGQYAESSYVGLIGHLTNEYVHHSAEVRLLRHLYRSGGAAIRTSRGAL